MDVRDAADAAYRRLRSLRPAKVRAIVGGESRDLAMTRGQHRWTRVLETAIRLGADGIECLDDAENVLEIIPLEQSEEHEHDSTDGVTEVERLVRVALDAADRAVARHAEHTRLALDALARVLDVASERTERLERALAMLVQGRHEERPSMADEFARQALALLAGAPMPTPPNGNGGGQA